MAKSIASIPVNYAGSDVLKVAATFEYDRYITGRASSHNVYKGDNENNTPDRNLDTQYGLLNRPLVPNQNALNAVVDPTGKTVLSAANATIA